MITQDPRTLRRRYNDPAFPARLGILTMVIFLMGMVGWGALAPLSGAAIAEGALQAASGRQSVQHPYGGVVREIMVHEGDRVERGQLLMTLNNTEPRAKLDILEGQRDALLATIARLASERDGKARPDFPPALVSRSGDVAAAQAMNNETAILKARAAQYQATIGVLEQKRAQASEEVAGKTAQLQAARDQLASVNDELVGAQKLLAAQLAPKARVLDLQRTATDLQSSIDVKTSEIASAKQSIAEIELQIDEFKRSWLTDIAQQLTKSQAELAELGPKLAAAEDELTRTRIVAPASGQVVGQTIVTEGGVIQAGAKLLDIVPSGGPMVVEARLPLTDIGEVEKGATADIRLLSTPARMRPHITGTVETVSADRLTDERSGQAYYQLRVALTAEDVARAGVELQAGMPVEIVIPTRPRTMLDYLISPLIDEISGSFRET